MEFDSGINKNTILSVTTQYVEYEYYRNLFLSENDITLDEFLDEMTEENRFFFNVAIFMRILVENTTSSEAE